jgi:hypothetical protein
MGKRGAALPPSPLEMTMRLIHDAHGYRWCRWSYSTWDWCYSILYPSQDAAMTAQVNDSIVWGPKRCPDC